MTRDTDVLGRSRVGKRSKGTQTIADRNSTSFKRDGSDEPKITHMSNPLESKDSKAVTTSQARPARHRRQSTRPFRLLDLPPEIVVLIYWHATRSIASERGILIPGSGRFSLTTLSLTTTVACLSGALTKLGVTRQLRRITYETFFEQVTAVCYSTSIDTVTDLIFGEPVKLRGPLANSTLFKRYGRYLRVEIQVDDAGDF